MPSSIFLFKFSLMEIVCQNIKVSIAQVVPDWQVCLINYMREEDSSQGIFVWKYSSDIHCDIVIMSPTFL